MSIRVTRFRHSCVRLDRDGSSLVLDPGTLSDLDAALEGVTDLLVTHDHADHLDVARVAARSDVRVHGPRPVVDALLAAGVPADRLSVVRRGDAFDAAGFPVRVVGEAHAVVHPDLPVAVNVGYLVAGVLHPGDSFVDPDGAAVDLLLLPIGGPWLKASEAVDYVRTVRPARVAAIHDAHLSDAGRALVKTLVDGLGGVDLTILGDGESIEL